MENHLLIGLGGTGGRVLASFRKLMYERFRGDVKPKDMWIDYLYVDSSEQDLKMKDPAQWSVMGNNIALDADSIVKIPAANLADYVNNRSRFKYLSPWLGDSQDWKNIINDPKISEGAAGQKRRLGRLLFANGSPEFNKMVGVKARNLSYNPDGRKVTYHVIAGLAGGTGSGSVVDVVAQLRNQFPDQQNNKVILYLLLPEEHPNPEWASTNNYQPNGYVALGELSAMDLGAFKPWNLSERDYDVLRLTLELPFYSAYLVTDTNREDVRFDVGKVIPSTIAELLYQKTVGVALSDRKIGEGTTESAAHFFNNVEKGENPDYADYDSPHSHKFNSFGIKRLAIPEQEIKEYAGYSYANQAILKMLYNNLSRETGYVSEAPTNDDYAFVTKPEQKQKWCISREHLCLSKPILPEHKKEGWLSLPEEFNQIDDFARQIHQNGEITHKDKLIATRNKAKRYFDKDFRPIAEVGQNGVVTFYEKKARFGREAIVSSVMSSINADLLQLWQTGERSLLQLSGIAQTILKYFEEEKETMTRLASAADDEVKKRDTALNELNAAWCDMGIGGKLLAAVGGNNKAELIQRYNAALKEKYILMAWKESYAFAKLLIDDLLHAVLVTKGDIDDSITQFKNANEILFGSINSRCLAESEEKQSLKGVVIKSYDAAKVHTIIQGAIANENDNEERVRLAMAAVTGMLNPEKKNFREVSEKLKTGTIVNVLEQAGISQAENFFVNEVGRTYIPGYEKLIGVNIIQKLQEEFSGNDEGLKEKLGRLVRHAAILNKHRGVEVNNGPKVRSSMFVILPDYDKDKEYLQKVEDTIKSLTPEGQIKVSRGGNSNEIVVITLETNLTPRYLQAVYTLKQNYERLMGSKQGQVARFETQLEDYKGFIPMGIEKCIKHGYLPSLYKPTDDEQKEIEEKFGDQILNAANLAQAMTANTVAGNGMVPPPPPPMAQYFLYVNNQQQGPFAIPELQQKVAMGMMDKNTYVWKNGMPTWALAGSVPELACIFMTGTPPPPPPMMM